MKKYEETKFSGLDWLGEIPAHWQVKRLKNIARINPLKNISDDADDTVTFLPMEKVSEKGEIDCSLKRPVKDLLAGFTYFERNDIILAKITPCFENGKGAYLDKLDTPFGFGSTEFHVIRTHDDLNSTFLYYVTTSNLFRDLGEASMTGSGGQKRVPTSFVENFPLAYPLLPEQRAIAAYLDRKTAQLDTLLAQKEALLQKLQQKRQALINEAVTQGLNPSAPRKSSGVAWLGEVPAHWLVSPLKRITQFKYGNALQGGTRDSEGVVKVYGSNGVVGRHNVAITQAPCIIIGRKGSYGKVNYSDEPCYPIDTAYYIDGTATKNHLRFVYYLLQTCGLDEFSRDSAVPGLSREEAYSKILALPPLDEQQAIVDFIEAKTSKINEASDTVRTQIKTLKSYRQSLISEVVTGKVDVRPAVPTAVPVRGRPTVVQTSLFN